VHPDLSDACIRTVLDDFFSLSRRRHQQRGLYRRLDHRHASKAWVSRKVLGLRIYRYRVVSPGAELIKHIATEVLRISGNSHHSNAMVREKGVNIGPSGRHKDLLIGLSET
jgi:hypothetical protein